VLLRLCFVSQTCKTAPGVDDSGLVLVSRTGDCCMAKYSYGGVMFLKVVGLCRQQDGGHGS